MDPFLWGPMASTVQSRTRCPEWRAHPLQPTKSWRSSPWPPCKYHAVALIPTPICRTVAFALFLCSFGDVYLGGNIIQFKHIICKKKKGLIIKVMSHHSAILNLGGVHFVLNIDREDLEKILAY